MNDSNAPKQGDGFDTLSLSPTLQDHETNGDGRVDIDIDPRASKQLDKILTSQTSHDPANARPLRPLSPTSTPPPNLNILIQVIGSRGDIQPFAALGHELQKHGHRVRLATHDTFRTFVQSAGLEFFPVGGDPSELMAYMVKNPGLIPSMGSIRAGDIQAKRKMVAEMLDGFWRSCIDADPETGAPFVADAIVANPPGLGDLVNRWREDTLCLEPIATSEGCRLLESLAIPFAYFFSPALVPRPVDWGSNIDVCGFVFRDPPKYEPPAALRKFLDAGSRPVYIGFGSIVVDDADRIATIIHEAVSLLGIRAIISSGWTNLASETDTEPNPGIFHIGECPHQWLFQQVAAVVHHGGAGTTACGLGYGKPTIVVPFFGDQPFWGRMIAEAGAGPPPIPYAALTSRKLADGLSYALSPQALAAALEIANTMSVEQGARVAVEAFHKHLPRAGLRCELFPQETAAWSYKGEHRAVRLSKRAVAILTARGVLEEKKLKLHETKPFTIDIQRWDPITAISAASVSTLADMGQATARLVYEPISEARQSSTSRQQSPARGSGASSPAVEKLSPSAALATSARAGKIVTSVAKGVLVSIPLAATEGLRAVPRLYGEDVKRHADVRDFKSGAAVAGQEFRNGIAGAAMDIVTYTYRGKRDEGPMGVAKGLAKGVVSLAAKTGAAVGGLVAYPVQGAYRGIRATVRSTARESIESAKREEGIWLVRQGGESSKVDAVVIADFESLKRSRDQ
ncbi:Sterol 3-beta-glucosyltransferase UGT80A2 like protein [Verticillium longisporum]|nr:Sterol 3-beta-glucosyltransferase UGT80A2 like protein [Verticillium longisporum]